MKYQFEIKDFPDKKFALEVSNFTGKSKLYMNDIPLQQSDEKGKPFLIPNGQGGAKAFVKNGTFPDAIPYLEINGEKHLLAEKLKWFEYILGGMPIVLLFVGGGLGGIIGALACMINFSTIRQTELDNFSKYAKVFVVTFLAFVIFFGLALLFHSMIN